LRCYLGAYSGEAGHPFRFLTDTFLKKKSL